MALVQDDVTNCCWKLPYTLLAIRTTIKPDRSASPAELVFGEGLAVPGDILGTSPSADVELERQRRNLIYNLRFEVARIQSTSTSTPKRPKVHVPMKI